MKDFFKYLILGLLTLVGVSFALSYTSYAEYSFFAPRYVAVENRVFHESAPYNEGMVRDLENLKREYEHADANGKASLKATILHRFEVYPKDRLTPDLERFYDSINN